jgi:hypothetical protein
VCQVHLTKITAQKLEDSGPQAHEHWQDYQFVCNTVNNNSVFEALPVVLWTAKWGAAIATGPLPLPAVPVGRGAGNLNTVYCEFLIVSPRTRAPGPSFDVGSPSGENASHTVVAGQTRRCHWQFEIALIGKT